MPGDDMNEKLSGAQLYLFRKFSGNPDRGQSIATNCPLPDSVM
jgi:hypothetical protein